MVLPANSRSRAATEPPPTFPFLESQCQRAALRHELSLCQRSNAARKNVPAGGVEGVYREAVRACQTGNGPRFGFFAAPLPTGSVMLSATASGARIEQKTGSTSRLGKAKTVPGIRDQTSARFNLDCGFVPAETVLYSNALADSVYPGTGRTRWHAAISNSTLSWICRRRSRRHCRRCRAKRTLYRQYVYRRAGSR